MPPDSRPPPRNGTPVCSPRRPATRRSPPNDARHDYRRRQRAYNPPEGRASRTTRPLDRTGRSQMAKWIRFEQDGKTGFGTLEGDSIAVHAGDMFAGATRPAETAETFRRAPAHAVRSLEDDLPVEQFPPARRQERFHGAERAAVVPEGAERLLAGERADRAPSTYAGRSSTKANSASSSARNAQHLAKPRPATTSSATPASTTSPPSTCCTRTSRSSNGRAPRVSTPSASSAR